MFHSYSDTLSLFENTPLSSIVADVIFLRYNQEPWIHIVGIFNARFTQPFKTIGKEPPIRISQIAVHKDEGHYDKDINEWKPNYHAHLVADWQDLKTDKTLKHQSFHYSKMQDITAECFGRGKRNFGFKSKVRSHTIQNQTKNYRRTQERNKKGIKFDEIFKNPNNVAQLFSLLRFGIDQNRSTSTKETSLKTDNHQEQEEPEKRRGLRR